MVIAFLIGLMLAELGGFILLLAAMDSGDQSSFIPGWLLGLVTAATGYVLFYQIFPVEML